MTINKQKYRELCKRESSIPIFSKDWWLDAVCGEDNWDVIIIEKGNDIIATLPFNFNKEYGFTKISMPKLTQNMGIWIKHFNNQKTANKLSNEKKIMTQLIEQLPPFYFFGQNFHYSITNWLPFYWKGFKQTTKYTYVIEDLSNLESVFKNFRGNIKTDIRKAEKVVKVYTGNDIEKFYSINKKTFDRQNKKIRYSLDFLMKLDKVCIQNKCREIFFAEDEKNRIHSAVYLVWDDNSAYYLLSGGDPQLRNSGATSLLVWSAIKFTAELGLKFDFEGSMLESIERFFRSFNAIPKTYFYITKKKSKISLIIKSS